MKLLDIAVGLIGGYFVYTEKGRNQAMQGINTGVQVAKKYASYYLKDLIPKIPDDGMIENAKPIQSVSEDETEE